MHGQAGDDTTVADQVLDPVGRIGRVDGDECRTGFRHRECGEDGFGRARNRNRHSAFGSGARRDQDAGQAVGVLVDLTVGHGGVAAAQRHRLRVECRTGRDDFGEGARCDRIGSARGHQPILLLRGDDMDGTQRRIRSGGQERVQEHREAGMVCRQFIGAVQVPVALQIDVGALATDARIQVEEHVIDQPGCQHVQSSGDRAELNPGVHHHQIDDRTE